MLWVIMGDFNESLIGEDKFRGRPVSVNRSLLLKKCLDKCNMIDLGFSGPCFTWTIRREVQGLIQERIDRFFCQSKLVFALAGSKSNSSYQMSLRSLPSAS